MSARLFVLCLAASLPGAGAYARPLAPGTPVRGWTILSKSEPDARATIAAARAYGINHLQLSHLLVHDLREIKDEARRSLVNELVDAGHAAGIEEVVLWDHALYPLDYYPAEFRTGPARTIDLDNPAFWEWLKADYRAMLDLVPRADGLVLTFIETGARAERQQSRSYVLHVSGKWLDPPIAPVAHGVDRELHYWRDVVDHLAPPFVKEPLNRQWNEVRWIWDRGWIKPGEGMDEEFLRHVLAEKDHGAALAARSARHIEDARPALAPADFEQLHHHFQHTLLTARLHRAVAGAYFGYRVWARGGAHRTDFVRRTVEEGLSAIQDLAPRLRSYPVKPPTGQWDWTKDADEAERYFRWIAVEGWPKETRGVANPQAGVVFPFPDGARSRR